MPLFAVYKTPQSENNNFGGVFMDDWYMWQAFFTTGSVLDYLRYKGIQNAKDTGADTVTREDTDEIPNAGSYNQGTEYR